MSRMPEVGSVVDEVFRIEESLDEGNFGAIYRARDLLEDRALALKVHKPGPHDAEEVRQRFEREARLIYRLEHPNVVQVHYYGQTANGLPYMAMEYLEGTDLKALLRQGYELSTGQISRIAQATLAALEAAHEMGIIHRDLKPANVFLVEDDHGGDVKVLDFGFAKALDEEEGSNLTSTETLVGSPAYMAPELVHKNNVGPVSDLYALGLIVGEMVTGQKLVDIESIYDTISFQASDKPVSIPPAVERSPFSDIVRKAVQKDPSRRYQSAAEMRRELQRLSIAEEPAPSLEDTATSASLPHGAMSAEDDTEDEIPTEPEARGMPPRREVKNLTGQDPERATGPTDATVVTDNPLISNDGSSDGMNANDGSVRGRESTPSPQPDAAGSESADARRSDERPGGRNTRPPTAEVNVDEESSPPRRSIETRPNPSSGTESGDREREPPVRLIEVLLGAALGVIVLAGVALLVNL